jgi:hypothetical protein
MLGNDIAADDWIVVGKPLPRIEQAEPLSGRNVRLLWRGRSEPTVVDIAPALANLRIFKRLRTDDGLFRQLAVNEDGNALEWPDGAELSAVWIERLAEAALDNAQFREAMDEMHMSLDGMAAHLGVSRRLIADYRKDKPIPRLVALATRYLLERRRAAF